MIVSQQRIIISLMVLAVVLTGCAGPVQNMRPVSEDKVVGAPMEGKALVVFMRPSGHAFTIQSSVYAVQSTKPILIGIVAAKKKVSFEADPGKYLFMVIGENADFLSAEILPNKTYYVRINPGFGIWKADFTLEPVGYSQLERDSFNRWLSECEWVEKTPKTAKWLINNTKNIEAKYLEYYPEWLSKDSSEKLVLLPEDGI